MNQSGLLKRIPDGFVEIVAVSGRNRIRNVERYDRDPDLLLLDFVFRQDRDRPGKEFRAVSGFRQSFSDLPREFFFIISGRRMKEKRSVKNLPEFFVGDIVSRREIPDWTDLRRGEMRARSFLRSRRERDFDRDRFAFHYRFRSYDYVRNRRRRITFY